MARELKAIDISHEPALLRLVEEVRSSNEPRVLRLDHEDLAIVVPAKRQRSRRTPRAKTRADYEAFRSAAGTWEDVDTDKLLADIAESRRLSPRPPVEL